MEKEYETEVVKGIEGNRGLNLARQALRKNRRKKRISKICSIVIPLLIGIILLGTPTLMHYRNRGKIIYWKEMIVQVTIDYSELEKTSSVSIEELNKEKNGKFYWLDNMTRTESYILTYKKDIALIEEHYNYEGIECIIYIRHSDSKIQGIEYSKELLQNSYVLEKYSEIHYGFIENENCYAELLSDYFYLLSINSTDTTIVESIFSNLTND